MIKYCQLDVFPKLIAFSEVNKNFLLTRKAMDAILTQDTVHFNTMVFNVTFCNKYLTYFNF